MVGVSAIRGRQEAGAAGIEFVLVFLVFFLLFYGMVSYGFFFMLQNSFIHAAEEGARAAIRVDPLSTDSCADYKIAVEAVAKSTAVVALDWLPNGLQLQALGTDNANIKPEFNCASKNLTVLIEYANYRTNPILPVLNFPGIGPIIPADLEGRAVLRLF